MRKLSGVLIALLILSSSLSLPFKLMPLAYGAGATLQPNTSNEKKWVENRTAYWGQGWPTDSVGNMQINDNNDNASNRFVAQNSKTPARLYWYVGSSELGTGGANDLAFRVGLQGDDGTANHYPGGNWICSGVVYRNASYVDFHWNNVTVSGCGSLTAGTIYHIVAQYESGTINATHFMNIRARHTINDTGVNENLWTENNHRNTLRNLAGSWALFNREPIYIVEFDDGTSEGNAYEGEKVFNIADNDFGSEVFKVNESTTIDAVNFWSRWQNAIGPAGDLFVQLRFYANESVIATANFTSDQWSRADKTWNSTALNQTVTLLPGTWYRLVFRCDDCVGGQGYQGLMSEAVQWWGGFFEALETTYYNFNNLTWPHGIGGMVGEDGFEEFTDNGEASWNARMMHDYPFFFNLTAFIPPPVRIIGELPSVEDAVSNDTTTSATYEDVDALSVNITTLEQADILIMASIQAEGNVSAVASYRLVFDGVNFQGLRRQVGTLAGNMVLVDLVENKTAGNYELKLQHNVTAGLLSTINTTVYAVQLHNGNGRVPANSSFTASDTIASAVAADISGLETEITLSRTSHVWMALTWAGEYSLSPREGNFTIEINSVNMETRFRNWPSSNEWGALSLITRTNQKLPNDTYTVKGIWQGDNTGTLTGMNFSLVVLAGEANGTVAEFEIQKVFNSDDTTTATAFEDIDDLTLNFTTPDTSHVMGFLTFDSEVSNINTDIFNSININGTDQEEMKRGHASPSQSLGSLGQVVRTNSTLSAGEGNMTGRWHTDAANTASGFNLILVSIVLFTEDTGVVELTIIFHTGISQVLVDSVSEANLTVIVVTLGDTVNISSTVSTDFTFYRYEILELGNHTHFAEYDQVMNQDLTVEAFTLSIGAGPGVAGVSMLLFAIIVGFAVIVLIVASRKR